MNTDRRELAGTVLARHEDVLAAVVIDTADPALLAYVLPTDFCNGADLRDALIDAIGTEPTPPLVLLATDQETFDTTKADHAALTALASSSPYVYRWTPPVSAAEVAVTEVIAVALQRDRVSLSDDFVDLGGDSVTAIEVVSELAQRVGATLPLEAMFEAGSVAELVRLAERSVPAR